MKDSKIKARTCVVARDSRQAWVHRSEWRTDLRLTEPSFFSVPVRQHGALVARQQHSPLPAAHGHLATQCHGGTNRPAERRSVKADGTESAATVITADEVEFENEF